MLPHTERAQQWRATLATAAPLLLSALLLTLALLHPAAQTIDVGAPGDAYFLANFYPGEVDGGSPYRWSGPGAHLLLPAAYRGPILLTMRLRGAAFAPPEDLRVSLERPGAPPVAFGTDVGWRVYRVLLPPGGSAASGGQAPLDLIAPANAPGPDDPRPLGAALGRVGLRFVGPAPILPALLRALAIMWGLAIIGWVGATTDHRPPTTGDRRPLSRRSGQWSVVGRQWLWIMFACGAALALWAWRDPGGFAWAVPTPPLWLLILATAIVAGWPLVGRAAAWAGRAGRGALRPYVAWALIGHLALLLPLPWRGLGALLVLGLPGWLAARALFPEVGDALARLFLGICGAVAVAPLLILALHAIPGPLPGWLLLLASDLLSIAMLMLLARERRDWERQQAAPTNTLFLLLLAVGIALRLTLLGGAEFQGDEARAMLLAAGVAQGDDSILLAHRKGPVEALLPAGPLILAGSGVEWVARLPFALAGVGLLLGVVVLARELFLTTDDRRPTTDDRPVRAATAFGGRWSVVALVALALLATDGFALGFARIVQYQSVVMLSAAGAFWACWKFYTGAERPARYLISAAALLAAGLLAHYDAAMVAPALAWLVIAGGVRRGWRPRAWLAGLGPPVLIGGLLLASFYVPYVTSPSFAATAEYLAGRAGEGAAGGPPFNNLPLYFNILSFYNAPPLVPLLAAALALGLLLLTFAGGAAAIPLALWFGVPFAAESFLIAEPRTHFYSAHPAAALIIGFAVASVVPRGSRSWVMVAGRRSLVALGALWLALSLGYAQLLYLRQFPEYERNFPDARPGWLRASYGDEMPQAGYFGFPHNDGWKAAAELYRAGVISGSYNTNQNHWLAGWYMRRMPRCTQDPDYYLIATAETSRYFPPGYDLLGEVVVGPARRLAIYSRAPVGGPPQIFDAQKLAAAFDARPVETFPAATILEDAPEGDCSRP